MGGVSLTVDRLSLGTQVCGCGQGEGVTFKVDVVEARSLSARVSECKHVHGWFNPVFNRARLIYRLANTNWPE